jgi:predicted RNA binding protein YcfA (HicA-like mRNA interferase family)
MSYSKPPAITGPQLIKLLKKDGWEDGRKATHGRTMTKRTGDKTKVTFIPERREPLIDKTLGQILGLEQTGIGKAGLADLIEKYGLR